MPFLTQAHHSILSFYIHREPPSSLIPPTDNNKQRRASTLIPFPFPAHPSPDLIRTHKAAHPLASLTVANSVDFKSSKEVAFAVIRASNVAWTLGRICYLIVSTLKPDEHLHGLIYPLVRLLDDKARIVANSLAHLSTSATNLMDIYMTTLRLLNSPGLPYLIIRAFSSSF